MSLLNQGYRVISQLIDITFKMQLDLEYLTYCQVGAVEGVGFIIEPVEVGERGRRLC